MPPAQALSLNAKGTAQPGSGAESLCPLLQAELCPTAAHGKDAAGTGQGPWGQGTGGAGTGIAHHRSTSGQAALTLL